MSHKNSTKLKFSALVAVVVGSMIGGGIFSLPQNIAVSANVNAVLIGWGITALGMLMLAFVFQILANRKPQLNGGVYAHAKAGFGDYIGFCAAWGYWLSAWLGNVGYFVLLFSTLGYFFPVFGQGNTPTSIICASVLLWTVHSLVLRGIAQATFVNLIATTAKIVPIFLFIVICLLFFKFNLFTSDIWGHSNPLLGNTLNQVRHMMLVTVWVFIGIEGASVFSSRAKNPADVGKATLLGFIIVLLLLVLVSLLSFGIMSQQNLAKLQNPSMMGVLEHAVGPWGAYLVCAGLIISLFGALLSWALLCAEIVFIAAKDHTMPLFLRYENANRVPANALWLTNILIQIFLIIILFSGSTYLTLVYLSSSMILIPYLGSAAYTIRLAISGETYSQSEKKRTKEFIIATLAAIYALWLLYAGGIKYLLLSALLYVPGAILFAKAKREAGKTIFKPIEKCIFVIMMIGALIAAYALHKGFLTL